MRKIIPPSPALPQTSAAGRPDIPAAVEVTRLLATPTLIANSTPPIPGLTRLLWNSPREDLVGLIQQDGQLIEGIYGRFPESSSLLGFDEFDLAWVRQFAPQILRGIGHLKEVQQWSMTEATFASMAIDRIVSDLLSYLGLPETQTLACTALVIIFIKGLNAERRAEPHGKP